MPGMGHLLTRNPTIVSAFHSSLGHHLLVVGLISVVLALAWNILRTARYRAAVAAGKAGAAHGGHATGISPEPLARRVVRTGFGMLWILDGVLQIQASIPQGVPVGVMQPAAHSSPAWVQDTVNVGVTIWSNHPVVAAVSVAWIELGIGVLLLVAPRGRWSQCAGLASVGWGTVVWIFGEAFGGIFGGGTTWLFGTPGAALFYCVAGGLVALPERVWATSDLGKWILRALGCFFIGMAVLQAWPGRGF